MSKRVLVTGATGFVGTYVCRALQARGHTVRAAVRRSDATVSGAEMVLVGDIHESTEWSVALEGVDSVIHLAARVHLLRDTAADPAAEHRRINTAGTIHLARSAQAAGVRRFVFLSTLHVNGEATPIDQPFTEASEPAPRSPYAISKWEAEQALNALPGIEIVIVRPPLVYGAGVKANFAQLVRFVQRGLPLPFGWTNNRRSLIAVQNLADFLVTCAEHPDAAGETFLVSDGDDISTTELLRRVGAALGKTPPLLPVPPAIMQAALGLVGRERMASQLFGSLVVDSRKARQRLGWTPPLTMPDALRGISEA